MDDICRAVIKSPSTKTPAHAEVGRHEWMPQRTDSVQS